MTVEAFKEKLSTLNKCFVDKITEEFNKTPHADFTPCLMDYIKHLGGIDEECCSHCTTNNGIPSPKISVQKAAKNPLLPTNVPKLPPPEPVKSGRIGGKLKRKASSNIENELEDNEEKVLDKNSIFAVPASPKFTKPAEPKTSLFGNSEKPQDTQKPVSLFNFGTIGSKAPSTNIFTSPPTSGDGKDKNATEGKSLSSFGINDSTNIFKKPEDPKDEKSTAKTSFPSLFGSSDTSKPLFSFTSNTTFNEKKEEKDGSSKSTLPTFSFKPTPVVEEKKDGEDDKNEEGSDEGDEPQEKYDPLQADKDAIYNVKCSLHQLVEKQYIKKGVAFINVKEMDGKKILVVRATNAVGTILINTHINENLKTAKLEGTKIRLSFPNSDGSGMETWVTRVPGASDVEEVLENLKP
uniref:RanBD1 domain-containing protein n=1 Tax=Strongyloides papillosus TaxID=174720 RepID=A0A0N5C858_STREA